MSKLNKVFTKNDKIINISWGKSIHHLGIEMQILLVLTSAYVNKTITLEKLKGQLSSLRKGTLQKFKQTYHCGINNRWYNDESASEVFKDIGCNNEISYDDLIEVLQLYTGKNYNYCINMIIDSIIRPLLNYFSNSYYNYFNQIFSTNLSEFPELKQKGYETHCYECGHRHFESDSKRTREQITEITDFFHNYKKGNLTKIPKTL